METKAIDLQQIQKELIERLDECGWLEVIGPYLQSEKFSKILKYLLNEVQEGRRFTPKIKQLFRAFQECPYNDVKVVMIGQDSYPYLGVADGIAFSCSNDGQIQKSLKYMYQEIQRTVYNDGFMEWRPDLKYLSNQGVLLINSAFTCQVGKIGSHYDLWREFVEELLKALNEMHPMAFVFLGNVAKDFGKFITEPCHYKQFVTHPATAGYNKTFKWDSEDCFNEVNKFLVGQYNTKIEW